jgi:hypothetical protein
MIRLGSRSYEDAKDIWAMCARDFLFYVNTFCWTFDPRRNPSALPFITYLFQDYSLLQIDESIDNPQPDGGCGEDILTEKSRDMGASWMSLLPIEWRWHFRPRQSFLCVSRKEDYVDKYGDPKSLFWKFDFIHKNLPGWLRPTGCDGSKDNPYRAKLHLLNPDNESVIDGESTTGDVARGDRRTAILLDEFAFVENGDRVLASTGDATNCRIFNSTPNGTGNAFYTIRERQDRGLRILRLHWTVHPLKAKGLYYDEDGKPHSPWYDKECKRRASALEIAQELDIDYLASGSQFFDQGILDRIKKEDVCIPAYQGEIAYCSERGEFIGFSSDSKGDMRLWCDLIGGNPPTDTNYSIGCDVATGTGASNSVISVADATTGRKVAEYSNSHIMPHRLAFLAVAIARWFKGECGQGYLIWENNGPGRIFGNTVKEIGYRHVYYRRNENSLSRKETDTPGWASTKENKLSLLGGYRRALASRAFVNRHLAAIEECEAYVYLPGGGIAHQGSQMSADPSGAKDNHGDRVIADALACMGCGEQARAESVVVANEKHCFAARRESFERSRRSRSAW